MIIITSRLRQLSENYAVMEGSQYGFRAHRGVQIVIQRAHWVQQQAMEESGTLIRIDLDFKNVFNSVEKRQSNWCTWSQDMALCEDLRAGIRCHTAAAKRKQQCCRRCSAVDKCVRQRHHSRFQSQLETVARGAWEPNQGGWPESAKGAWFSIVKPLLQRESCQVGLRWGVDQIGCEDRPTVRNHSVKGPGGPEHLCAEGATRGKPSGVPKADRNGSQFWGAAKGGLTLIEEERVTGLRYLLVVNKPSQQIGRGEKSDKTAISSCS